VTLRRPKFIFDVHIPSSVQSGRIVRSETRSIFDRYNVVDEADVRSAMVKYEGKQKAAVEALETELRSSTEVGHFQAVSGSEKQKVHSVN
jgi:hypothetical protein